MPNVYLRLDGDHLRDISLDYWLEYQKQIDDARGRLTPIDLAGFRKQGKEYAIADEIERLVLTIVLANLYGGHPKEAWKALDELWPPSDIPRIRSLILKTRGKGFSRRGDN
jgi:hypothetical protein